MKTIILAGGSGTRLFPLSRLRYPKQFLKLNNSLSLFQETYNRVAFATDNNDILIITNQKQEPLIARHISELKKEADIILEPTKRNTASAIALGISFLLHEKKASVNDVIFVCPSDHVIKGLHKFKEYVKKAEAIAKQGFIVTFGIVPTAPHTGYGYIEAGNFINSSINYAYKVRTFHEKPDYNTAQKYIDSGNFYWNSGMFAFTIKTILQEFNKYSPAIYKMLENYNYQQLLQKFEDFPDIAIDYAVMEHTKKAAVIPTDLIWSDIGSWESVYDILKKDKDFNVSMGNNILLNTHHSLIINTNPDQLITTYDLDHLIIINSKDVITILKHGDGQHIREIVKTIENKKSKHITEYSTTQVFSWGQIETISLNNPYIFKATILPQTSATLTKKHFHIIPSKNLVQKIAIISNTENHTSKELPITITNNTQKNKQVLIIIYTQ